MPRIQRVDRQEQSILGGLEERGDAPVSSVLLRFHYILHIGSQSALQKRRRGLHRASCKQECPPRLDFGTSSIRARPIRRILMVSALSVCAYLPVSTSASAEIELDRDGKTSVVIPITPKTLLKEHKARTMPTLLRTGTSVHILYPQFRSFACLLLLRRLFTLLREQALAAGTTLLVEKFVAAIASYVTLDRVHNSFCETLATLHLNVASQRAIRPNARVKMLEIIEEIEKVCKCVPRNL